MMKHNFFRHLEINTHEQFLIHCKKNMAKGNGKLYEDNFEYTLISDLHLLSNIRRMLITCVEHDTIGVTRDGTCQ